MTEPTKLSEAVARAIVLADGLNPLERVGAADEVLWRWEINTPRAHAAIRVVLEGIVEPGPDTIAAGDTEDSAMSLNRWQAMLRHLIECECG